MERIDDGGWAFPRPAVQGARSYEDNEPAEEGMTLRDYFAAAAMTGLCAYSAGRTPENMAPEAYRVADALILARKK